METNWEEELKMHSKINKKIYHCMKCGREVWSLICRRIDGEDWDICSDCLEKEESKCL